MNDNINAPRQDDYPAASEGPPAWRLNIRLICALGMFGLFAGFGFVDASAASGWLVVAGALGVLFGIQARVLSL